MVASSRKSVSVLWIIQCLVFCLFGTTGCGAPPAPITHGPTEETVPSVLIAVRPSEFKQQIVDRLISRYTARARITLIEMEELAETDTDPYDAAVVMGARMGFLLFSGEERRFVDEMRHPDRTVMVMTAAVSDWEWDNAKIDVITGASALENVEPFTARISRRLDDILKK